MNDEIPWNVTMDIAIEKKQHVWYQWAYLYNEKAN